MRNARSFIAAMLLLVLNLSYAYGAIDVSLQSPANATYSTNAVNLTFAASGASQCMVQLDGTNLSYPVCANTTLTYVHYPDANKVLAMDFAEGTGNRTYDRSTRAVMGNFSGNANWTSGRHGTGLYLDGNLDYVIMPGPNISSKNFTVAFWAKREVAGTQDNIIGMGVGSTNNNLMIGFTSGNAFTCSFWNNDLSTSATYTDLDWHFWACTFDSVTRNRTIYRDGVQVASATASANYTGSGNLYIGKRANENSYDFAGVVDELVIYNRTLGAGELQGVYRDHFYNGTHSMLLWANDSSNVWSAASAAYNVSLVVPDLQINATALSPLGNLSIVITDVASNCTISIKRPDGLTDTFNGTIVGSLCTASYIPTFLAGNYSINATTNGSWTPTLEFNVTMPTWPVLNISGFAMNASTFYRGDSLRFSWNVTDDQGGNVSGFGTTTYDVDPGNWATNPGSIEIRRDIVRVTEDGNITARLWVEFSGYSSGSDIYAGSMVNITILGRDSRSGIPASIAVSNGSDNAGTNLAQTLSNSSGIYTWSSRVDTSFSNALRRTYLEFTIPANESLSNIIVRVDGIRYLYHTNWNDRIHIAGRNVADTEMQGGDDGDVSYHSGDAFGTLGRLPIYLSLNPNENSGIIYQSFREPYFGDIPQRMTASGNAFQSTLNYTRSYHQNYTVGIFADKWGYAKSAPALLNVTFTDRPAGANLTLHNFSLNRSTFFPLDSLLAVWTLNDTGNTLQPRFVNLSSDPNVNSQVDSWGTAAGSLEIRREIVNISTDGTLTARLIVEFDSSSNGFGSIYNGTRVNITLLGRDGQTAMPGDILVANLTTNPGTVVNQNLTSNAGIYSWSAWINGTVTNSKRQAYLQFTIPSGSSLSDVVARIDFINFTYDTSFDDRIQIGSTYATNSFTDHDKDGSMEGGTVYYATGDTFATLGEFPIYLPLNPSDTGLLYGTLSPNAKSLVRNITDAGSGNYQDVLFLNDYTKENYTLSLYADKWGYGHAFAGNLSLNFSTPYQGSIAIQNFTTNTSIFFPGDSLNMSWALKDGAGTTLPGFSGIGEDTDIDSIAATWDSIPMSLEIRRKILNISENGTVTARLIVEVDSAYTAAGYASVYAGTTVNISIRGGDGLSAVPAGVVITNASENAVGYMAQRLTSEGGITYWSTNVTTNWHNAVRSGYLDIIVPPGVSLSDVIVSVDYIYLSYPEGWGDRIYIGNAYVQDGGFANDDGDGANDDGSVTYTTGTMFGTLGEFPIRMPLNPRPSGYARPVLFPGIERPEAFLASTAGAYQSIFNWTDTYRGNITTYVYADRYGAASGFVQGANITFDENRRPNITLANFTSNHTYYAPNASMLLSATATSGSSALTGLNSSDANYGSYNQTSVQSLEVRRAITSVAPDGTMTARLFVEFDTTSSSDQYFNSGTGVNITIYGTDGASPLAGDIGVASGMIASAGTINFTLTNSSGILSWLVLVNSTFSRANRSAYLEFTLPPGRSLADVVFSVDQVTLKYTASNTDRIHIGNTQVLDTQFYDHNLDGYTDPGTVVYSSGAPFGDLGTFPVLLSMVPGTGALYLKATSASYAEPTNGTITNSGTNHSVLHTWRSDTTEQFSASLCANAWGYSGDDWVCTGSMTLDRPRPVIVSINDTTLPATPANNATNITFTVNYTLAEEPAEPARIFVCNSTSVTFGGCAHKTFCSTAYSTSRLQSCNYTVEDTLPTRNNYWVLACTDSLSCSVLSSQRTFFVNASGNNPVIASNYTTPASPYFGATVILTANVTDYDNDLGSVNFTVIAPNGTTILESHNGTRNGDLWTSQQFTVDFGGRWNYTILARDRTGLTDLLEGQVKFINITQTLTPQVALLNQTVTISGQVNLSNGSPLRDYTLGIYFNGTRQSPSPTWLDVDRSYRKLLNVTERTGQDLSDFQVNLSVDTASLINAGKLQGGCEDLRFVSSSGTSLSYWIESGCNTTNTRVWVKMNLAANANTTIHMYYGDPDAVAGSDISSTFVFGDDFDDGAVDSNKWTGGSGFSESGGYLTGSSTSNRLQSVMTFTGNYTLETRQNTSSEAGNGHQAGGWYASSSNGINVLLHPTNAYYVRNDGGWAGSYAFTYLNQWVRITVNGVGATSTVALLRESDWANDTRTYSNGGLSSEYVALGTRNDNTQTGQAYAARWDWIFVRKHAPTLPVQGAWWAEEAKIGVTDAEGRYELNITTPLTQGNYEVLINGSSAGEYGQSARTLIVRRPPTISSNTTNGTPYFGASVTLVANVTDDNIHSVNFTLIAPDGIVAIDNSNGTVTGDLWASGAFTLDKAGRWNYTVAALDLDGNLANSSGQVRFLDIGETLTPQRADLNDTVLVSGTLNDSLGAPAADQVVVVYLNGTRLSPTSWHLVGWRFRQAINVSEMSGTNLSAYQVNATLDTRTPIAAGKMRADCGDIRVVDESGAQLPYWVRSDCNGTNTSLWVKVNLSASSNSSIYVYYGNATAVSQSNGSATMVLYENMSARPNGTFSGYAIYDPANQYVSLTNTSATLVNGHLYYSLNPGPSGYFTDYQFYTGGGNGDAQYFSVYATGITTEGGANGGYQAVFRENGNIIRLYYNGVELASAAQSGIGSGQWFNARIVRYANQTEVWFNNTLKINYTDVTRSTSGQYLHWGAGQGNGYSVNNHYIRSLVVGRYTQNPPALALNPEEEVAMTDAAGAYQYNITAPAAPGAYPVLVNASRSGEYGQMERMLSVMIFPHVLSNTTNGTPYFGASVTLVANVTDDNIHSVNFTVLAPSGAVVISNANGTNASGLWTSGAFTLSQIGRYNYTISALDADGNAGNSSGQVRFLDIGETLTPQRVNINQTFSVTGQVNDSLGTFVAGTRMQFFLDGTAQVPDTVLGDGSDGNLAVSAAGTIVNNYTHVLSNVSAGAYDLPVNDTSAFAAGDTVLVIQMQNATAGLAGTYEFATVASVSSGNITVLTAMRNSYYSGAFNTQNATAAQVVRVPEYRNATVQSGGSIVAKSWDGYSGGIVVIRASDTVNVAGLISANGAGFQGGRVPTTTYTGGQPGESILGIGAVETQSTDDFATSHQANAGGGGGGDSTDNAGDNVAGGGGGGSYATNGTACSYTTWNSQCGGAGTIYGNATLPLLGSGGGAGGVDDNAVTAAAGGAGGGIVWIAAGTLNVSGRLTANGTNGATATAEDGSGGGGSGGLIRVTANNLSLGSDLLFALGGVGGAATFGTNGGGNGGKGRIVLEQLAASGSIAGANYGSLHNTTLASPLTAPALTGADGLYDASFTAPAEPGDYDVLVNTSHGGEYGQTVRTLTVMRFPSINSNTTNQTPYRGASVYLIVNVSDDNIHSVNFTVIAPDGSVMIDNLNGTNASGLWTSGAFTLSQAGRHNYAVFALDADGNLVNGTGQVRFIDIGAALTPQRLNVNASFTVSGNVTASNGSLLPSLGLGLYVNGSLFAPTGAHLFARSINFSETQGLNRTDEHVRINITISAGRFRNENATAIFCNGTQIPFDGYALNSSGGYVTEFQGIARMNFTAYENKTCLFLYGNDDLPEMNISATGTGWSYVGSTSRSGDVYKINRGEQQCSGNSSSGEFTSVCGDSETTEMNEWCYWKGQTTGSQDFWLSSDDEGRFYVENATLITTGCCSGVTASYSTATGRYYSLRIAWSENGGGQYVSNAHASTNTNDIDTECYPFYGDEWTINYTMGPETWGTVTNESGYYNVTLTAPSTAGTYSVFVNATLGGEYGQVGRTLTVMRYPALYSNATNQTPYFGASVYVAANVSDDNIHSVNFTVIAPDGTTVISNANGTNASGIWQSGAFTLDQVGRYNYTISVVDDDSNAINSVGQIRFLNITALASPATVGVSAEFNISGVLLDSTVNPASGVRIFLSGVSSLPVVSQDAWWNSSFTTRKQINVTGHASSALSNYSLRIPLDTLNLISSGRMNVDCSDLRVADASGAALPFWFSGCNTTNTSVWVRISLGAGANASYYVYYNNSAATSNASARGAFLISENMTVSPAGTLTGNAVYNSTAGYVELTNVATGDQGGRLTYDRSLGDGYAAEFQFWTGGGFGAADAVWLETYATSNATSEDSANGGYTVAFDEFQEQIQLKWNGANIATSADSNIANSQWHNVTILHYGVNTKVYLDGVLRIDHNDSARTKTGTIVGWGARTGFYTDYHRIRNLTVRQYVAPEPTATAVLTEYGFFTNASGHYLANATSPAGFGNYSVMASASHAGEYGQSSATLEVFDAVPPVISDSHSINNSLLPQATSVQFNVSTDENANCQYNLTNLSFAYGEGIAFTGGQGTTNHTFAYSGLAASAWYNVSVKCQDISGNSNTDDWHATFRINTQPNSTVPTLSGPVFDDTDITCSATPTDAENTTLRVEYVWYNYTGGSYTPFLGGNTSNLTNGTLTTIATLGRGNTSIGEFWNCSVRTYDGVEYSPWRSAMTRIDNATSENVSASGVVERYFLLGEGNNVGSTNTSDNGRHYFYMLYPGGYITYNLTIPGIYRSGSGWNVTTLELLFEGYQENELNHKIQVYNQSSSAWVDVETSIPQNADAYRSYDLTSGFTDYVDSSGMVLVRFVHSASSYHNSWDREVYVDRLQLRVNSSDTPGEPKAASGTYEHAYSGLDGVVERWYLLGEGNTLSSTSTSDEGKHYYYMQWPGGYIVYNVTVPAGFQSGSGWNLTTLELVVEGYQENELNHELQVYNYSNSSWVTLDAAFRQNGDWPSVYDLTANFSSYVNPQGVLLLRVYHSASGYYNSWDREVYLDYVGLRALRDRNAQVRNPTAGSYSYNYTYIGGVPERLYIIGEGGHYNSTWTSNDAKHYYYMQHPYGFLTYNLSLSNFSRVEGGWNLTRLQLTVEGYQENELNHELQVYNYSNSSWVPINSAFTQNGDYPTRYDFVSNFSSFFNPDGILLLRVYHSASGYYNSWDREVYLDYVVLRAFHDANSQLLAPAASGSYAQAYGYVTGVDERWYIIGEGGSYSSLNASDDSKHNYYMQHPYGFLTYNMTLPTDFNTSGGWNITALYLNIEGYQENENNHDIRVYDYINSDWVVIDSAFTQNGDAMDEHVLTGNFTRFVNQDGRMLLRFYHSASGYYNSWDREVYMDFARLRLFQDSNAQPRPPSNGTYRHDETTISDQVTASSITLASGSALNLTRSDDVRHGYYMTAQNGYVSYNFSLSDSFRHLNGWNLSSLDLIFEGYQENDNVHQLEIYNYVTRSWDDVETSITVNAEYQRNYSLLANLSQYVHVNGTVFVRLVHSSASYVNNWDREMYVDELRLRMTQEPDATYRAGYNAAATITVTSPADNSIIYRIPFDVNFTVSDEDSSIANCSLYLDGILNQTNASVTQGVNTTFSISPANGSHTFQVDCYDTAPVPARYTSSVYSFQTPSVYIYGNSTVPTAYFNASVRIRADVAGTPVSVNFTVQRPDGTYVLQGANGEQNGEQWDSPQFTLDQVGRWNYSILALTGDGQNDTEEGQIRFLDVGEALSPNETIASMAVSVTGRINDSTGAPAAGAAVKVYLNGTLVSGSSAPWWNSSWPNRMQYNYSTSAAPSNDTMVLINLSTTSLIADGKMNADCSDVRFADSAGAELSFTPEPSTCNTTSTIFWVWTNTTAADQTLFAYYGNAGASWKTGYTNPDSSLILSMHFDNTSAFGEYTTRVFDFSGRGNNGTPTAGMTIIDGRFGKGRNVTGNADYINTPAINMNGNRTLMVWSYFPLYNTGSWRTLFQRQGGFYHHLLVSSSGELGVFNNGWSSSGFDIDTLSPGWHHITSVQTSGKTIFYIDGVNVGNASTQVTEDLSRIGNHDSGQTWGAFDEVRVYNRTLYPEEIESVYNATAVRNLGTDAATNASGFYNVTFTVPATPGTYEVLVNATYEGEYGLSIRSLGVTQAAAPIITILIPQNTTYDAFPVALNFTAFDTDGIDACWYTNSTGSNVTLAGCANTTFYPVAGQQLITIYANDTLGNTGWAAANFTFNLAPSVNITSPQNATYASSAINLTYTAADSDGVSACIVELNGYNMSYPLCSNTTLTYVHYNDAGKVLALDFAEGTGTVAYDRSTRANNGTFNGSLQWNSSGKHGYGIRSTSVTTYATFNSTAVDSQTVVFWINTTSLSNAEQTELFNGGDWNSKTGMQIIDNGQYSNNIYCRILGSGSYTDIGFDRSQANDGRWHQIACAYNHTSGAFSIYLDGQLKDSGSRTKSQWNGNWTFGGGPPSGSILYDELAVFNRTLTGTEIQSLYDESSFAGSHTLRVHARDAVGTWNSSSPVVFGVRGDSCTPSVGEAWTLDLADNCAISGLNISVTNWTITASGPGTVTIQNSNISYQRRVIGAVSGDARLTYLTNVLVRGG